MNLNALLCGLFLSLSMSSFARVPVEQCFDLYRNTLDEHKDISPAWTQIMLLSRQIPNIRFFSNYVSKKQEGFNPHPAFTKDAEHLKNNAPRDPIAALFQYLFPSPNGANFAINERQNDPVGHFKKNLPKLSTLLTLKLNYDKNLDGSALSENTSALVESLRGKNDKSKKTRKKFDPIRDSFSDIFVKACIFERTKDCQDLYPKNIVTHALLAYALLAANSIDEIYQSFPQLFCAEKGVRDFSEEDYNHLIANLSEQSTPDTLIRAILGKSFYEEVLPQPLPYANVFFLKDGKKITYPNCGETTLLNFFYYLWGDRGIINPDYIQETEHKLSFVQDPQKTKNWTILKNYFLEFNTISSSNAKEAQERWSHLLSDLNTENTHPSLRITYRQKNVCNVQGIGFFNILNVLEKILPDSILGQAFSQQDETKFKQATGKFDRLCELFSREGATLDWVQKKSQQKELTKAIGRLTFRLNKKDHFVWEFKEHSFHLEPVKKNENNWRENLDPTLLPDAIRAFICGNTEKHSDKMQHPSDFFAFQLHDVEELTIALDEALHHHKWIHLAKLIPQIVAKTLYTNDVYAQVVLYTLLHPFDEEASTELQWKTYIPDFKPLTLSEILEKGFISSFWWTNHYSIKENYDVGLHLIAGQKKALEPIKRIVETFPGALTQECSKYFGNSVFDAASYYDSICAYALSKLIQGKSYTNEDYLSFLKKLIVSQKDNSKWIQTFLKSERCGLSAEELYKNIADQFPNSVYANTQNVITFIDFLLSKGLDINSSSLFKNNVYNPSLVPTWINYAISEELFDYFMLKGIKIENEIAEFFFANSINALQKKYDQPEESFNFIVSLVDKFKIDLKKPSAIVLNKHSCGPCGLIAAYDCASYLLHVARFPELALRFIEKGADPLVADANGNNLLHILLSQEKDFSGLVEQIDRFIELGLDLQKPNEENITPLEIAFSNPRISLETKKLLLEKNKMDSEKKASLSFYGAQSGSVSIVQYFVEEEHMNVNQQDEQGNTLLHYACESLSAPLVSYLLQKGSSPFIINTDGFAPLHFLTIKEYRPIVFHNDSEEMNDDPKNLDELETELDNQIYILKLMQKYEVNLDIEDKNGASLFLLLTQNLIPPQGREKVLFHLLRMGADPAKKDHEGNHFWHYFFEQKNLYNIDNIETLKQIYTLLEKKNINLTTPNQKGVLPLTHLKNAYLGKAFYQFLGQVLKTLDLPQDESIFDYLNPQELTNKESYKNIKTYLFPCFSAETLKECKNKIYKQLMNHNNSIPQLVWIVTNLGITHDEKGKSLLDYVTTYFLNEASNRELLDTKLLPLFSEIERTQFWNHIFKNWYSSDDESLNAYILEKGYRHYAKEHASELIQRNSSISCLAWIGATLGITHDENHKSLFDYVNTYSLHQPSNRELLDTKLLPLFSEIERTQFWSNIFKDWYLTHDESLNAYILEKGYRDYAKERASELIQRNPSISNLAWIVTNLGITHDENDKSLLDYVNMYSLQDAGNRDLLDTKLLPLFSEDDVKLFWHNIFKNWYLNTDESLNAYILEKGYCDYAKEHASELIQRNPSISGLVWIGTTLNITHDENHKSLLDYVNTYSLRQASDRGLLDTKLLPFFPEEDVKHFWSNIFKDWYLTHDESLNAYILERGYRDYAKEHPSELIQRNCSISGLVWIGTTLDITRDENGKSLLDYVNTYSLRQASDRELLDTKLLPLFSGDDVKHFWDNKFKNWDFRNDESLNAYILERGYRDYAKEHASELIQRNCSISQLAWIVTNLGIAHDENGKSLLDYISPNFVRYTCDQELFEEQLVPIFNVLQLKAFWQRLSTEVKTFHCTESMAQYIQQKLDAIEAEQS